MMGSQADDSLQLLRDNRLYRICPNQGLRVIQNGGKGDFPGLRRDDVTETYVHLEGDPSLSQQPNKSGPYTSMLGIITDRGDTNRIGGEHESVDLDRCVADIAEALRYCLRGAVAMAAEVEITGCAVGHLRPCRQEHCPLEY